MIESVMEAARLAGEVLREGFGTSFETREKGRTTDLVTEYDGRAEAAVKAWIGERFPDHAILAEESGASGTGEWLWIVDPLDGTTSFAHGVPFFSVCIALEHRGEIVAGAVYEPMRDEMFAAEKGAGAWLGARKLAVSETGDLSRSLLATGLPYRIAENPHRTLERFCAVAPRAGGLRRLGSAGLDLAYVAAGRFEGYWETLLQPWDCAAGVLLVREAGGIVTDYSGAPHDIRGLETLATNGHIHEELRGAILSA